MAELNLCTTEWRASKWNNSAFSLVMIVNLSVTFLVGFFFFNVFSRGLVFCFCLFILLHSSSFPFSFLFSILLYFFFSFSPTDLCWYFQRILREMRRPGHLYFPQLNQFHWSHSQNSWSWVIYMCSHAGRGPLMGRFKYIFGGKKKCMILRK